MWAFFHGWRRKIGLMMLVLACVFTAGWLNSDATIDLAMISVGEIRAVLISGNQKFRLILHRHTFIQIDMAFPDIVGEAIENGIFVDDCFYPTIADWWSKPGRITSLYYIDRRTQNRISLTLIPYSSIVIPLTMLSAYILLSKPRNSASKKIAEAISTEQA